MIIRTILLIITCGCGALYYVASSNYQHSLAEILECRQEFKTSQDPYWQQYREWSALPLDQQFQSPWGRKPYGEAPMDKKSEYQRVHLLASLESIAAGKFEPGPYARELYGANWKTVANDKIADMQSRHQWMQYALLGTIVSSLAFIISILWLLVSIVSKVGKKNPFASSVIQHQNAQKETASEERASSSQPASQSAATAPVNSQPEPAAKISEDDSSVSDRISQRRQLQYNTTEFWSQSPPAAARLNKANWNHTVSEIPKDRQNDLDMVKTAAKPLTDNTPPSAFGPPQLQNQKNIAVSAEIKSEPEPSDLGKLTEELTALREYASSQQSRIEKYQDGYDWNILKNFCLRIIRCIDNLETQIEKLEMAGEDVTSLQNAYDELVFALESSSIEQYRPDLDSQYKGQEKCMEVVKQRKLCADPKRDGAIAAVIRPGYRYVVDSQQPKIVRTAQVMLYQAQCAVAAG